MATIKLQPSGAVVLKDGKVSCTCCGCGCRSIKITDPVLLDTLLNATTGTCFGVGPDNSYGDGWVSTGNGWSAEFFGELSPGKYFINTASFDFASKCFSFYLDLGNPVWAGRYEDELNQCGCEESNCENTVFTINGIEFPAYHQSDDPFDPPDNPKNTPPIFTFS
jgi:hypothetical protein